MGMIKNRPGCDYHIGGKNYKSESVKGILELNAELMTGKSRLEELLNDISKPNCG